MIQLLPGIRIKVPNRHSTYGRVKVKTIQLFLGKYSLFLDDLPHFFTNSFKNSHDFSVFLVRFL